MKLMKTSFISVFLLCTGCGALGPLTPKDGRDLPVKAYAQQEEQSAEKLLRTSPQARPNREQEILSRSTIRSEDPFDLPPEEGLSDLSIEIEPLSEDDSAELKSKS